ncbi:Hypothetical protein CINCED_3A013517 [Cinara cedri]|uniref:Uncharacterized protein n=1 Tax=Cinara cedri TaxID=506608 RepID=A0A5E4MSB4_9HEMI|nr:Hypothetical protein CINCED_3A013517 [Cinara cedri]
MIQKDKNKLWEMIKINWMKLKSNERVLEKVGERRSLMINIMERKIKFVRHNLIHHNDFLNDIFYGRPMGRRPRGILRINYFHDLEEKMACTSYQELKDAAKDTRG